MRNFIGGIEGCGRGVSKNGLDRLICWDLGEILKGEMSIVFAWMKRVLTV